MYFWNIYILLDSYFKIAQTQFMLQHFHFIVKHIPQFVPGNGNNFINFNLYEDLGRESILPKDMNFMGSTDFLLIWDTTRKFNCFLMDSDEMFWWLNMTWKKILLALGENWPEKIHWAVVNPIKHKLIKHNCFICMWL